MRLLIYPCVFAGWGLPTFPGLKRETEATSRASFFWVAGLVFISALLSYPSSSLADNCASLRSQIRAAGGASGSQAVQLRRQLAAIRAIERQRQCTAEKARYGLFNACRGLAQRRAGVERQIQQLGGSGSNSRVRALQARYAALGCADSNRAPSREASRSPKRSQEYVRRPVKHTMLFCVRLADGYYFPAPNSQFVGLDHAENSLDRCQYICDTKDIDLYALEDMSLETEEMVSVRTGRSYKELPTAFRYRDDPAFRTCDFQRYHRRVVHARARSATLKTMADVVIPVPTRRPWRNTDATVDPMQTTSLASGPEKRRVRIILPGYEIESIE